jgi:hypothetical protein
MWRRHYFDQVVSGYAALCRSIQQRLQDHTLQQQQQEGVSPTPQQQQEQQQRRQPSQGQPSQPGATSNPLEVQLDEEALAATLDIFGRTFLRLGPQDMFDTAAMAHAAGEVVAIANTFVSQPWKQVYHWAPWACTWWCQVGGVRVGEARWAMAGAMAGKAGSVVKRGAAEKG